MTHALRATSFLASAALLGLGVFAALSVTVTLRQIDFPDPPVVPILRIDEQKPPPPPVTRTTPPPEAPPVHQTSSFDVPSLDAPPAPSEFALPGQPPGPAEILNPRWLRRPSDLERYYPRQALRREVSGDVLLDCLVRATGALDCVIVSETPAHWGFGEAALRMARDHRMAPATRDGAAVEGRYRMRVPFELR
jgi:protein TonB